MTSSRNSGRAAFAALALLLAAAPLAGCATAYGKETWSGGFSETQLAEGKWSVLFSANGYTNDETTQTYWLYRAAQLTIEKGYDGFTITTAMNLASVDLPHEPPGDPRVIRAGHGGGVTYHYVYVPSGGYDTYKPALRGTIQMLRGPVTEKALKTYDAHRLAEALTPIIQGKKCGGNICPHVHRYLYPDAAPDPSKAA